MISYIDGNVYIQVPSDAVDTLAVAVLKEGRQLAQDSFLRSLEQVGEQLRQGNKKISDNLVVDLTDNLNYLDAFNTLLEYYGAE
jgi:hypothetical protein